MSLALKITVFVVFLLCFHDANTESEHSINTASTLMVDGRYPLMTTDNKNWEDSSSNSSHTTLAVDAETSIAKRNIGASSSSVDPTIFWQYKVAVGILSYWSPPLLVLATVGNTMSIIILQPTLRKSSTSFILSALALVDLLYVDVGLTRQWILNLFNYDLRLNSPAACKTHIFFIQFMQVLSPWTLVLLTVERFISVWKPLTCKELCSRQRIYVVWFGMVIISFLLVMHFFFAYDIITPSNRNSVRCSLIEETSRNPWFRYFYLVSFVLRTALPFIVLLSSSIYIVSRIIGSRRQRMDQMQAVRSNTDKTSTGKIPSSTVTMILVSVTFLMLQIPNDIYTLNATISGSAVSTPLGLAIDKLFFNTIVFFSYLNSSLNFINYFVTGRKFRQAAIHTVMCYSRCIAGRPKEKSGRRGRNLAAFSSGMATWSVTLSNTTTSGTSVEDLQE